MLLHLGPIRNWVCINFICYTQIYNAIMLNKFPAAATTVQMWNAIHLEVKMSLFQAPLSSCWEFFIIPAGIDSSVRSSKWLQSNSCLQFNVLLVDTCCCHLTVNLDVQNEQLSLKLKKSQCKLSQSPKLIYLIQSTNHRYLLLYLQNNSLSTGVLFFIGMMHSVHWGINPSQKHHPLFDAKPSLLNLQTVQVPRF